jgi:hypothetical protein
VEAHRVEAPKLPHFSRKAVRLSALRAGRTLFTPRKILVLISLLGSVDHGAIVWLEELGKLKKSNDLIGNRTRELPAFSIMSQLTTLPRALPIKNHMEHTNTL